LIYVCLPFSLKLSIVIVNYNVKHFLEQCLKSVQNATQGIDAEIFVVDNNSVDGSNEMVRALFPEVKLIANQDNVGFSTANNQAIKVSTGEYVLLLNPDTIVPENCFTKLLTYAASKPDLGGCGVHMVDGQGKYLPESKRGLPTPEVALYKMIGLNKVFPKSKKFGKYHLGYLPDDENNEVDVLAGAFMLLRKETLDQVGLLDETFFMYGEDIDLSYRITKGGWKNYYFAETSIIHYKGESTKKQSINYVRVFYKAMIIFAEKHYTGNNKNLFKLFINTAIYARAAIALGVNTVQKYWMPVVEAILIFMSVYWLKGYWEEHIKRGNEMYPIEMVTIHIPYYTATWIMSMWFLGSYRNRWDFSKMIQALLIGTALISIIYGFLPNSLRYSRGIILFGTLVVAAILFAWRTALHFLKYQTLNFSHRNNTKSILVGDKKNWNKVTQLLHSYNQNYQQLGYVNDGEKDSTNWLGRVNQLQEIVKIYDVNEIIFSTNNITAERTMQLMTKIGPHVNYYTLPADSNFVIGSHSKNANGLYFGDQIELNLSKQEYRSQKRIFDISFALVAIILSPVLSIIPRTQKWVLNSITVLWGKKTWVGYSSNAIDKLPKLNNGVYNTAYMLREPNELFAQNLDQLYAKNYGVLMDIRTILKG
jgi:O-antigen biosynthesis protein